MQHPETGFFVYAAVDAGGRLTATNYVSLSGGRAYNILNRFEGFSDPTDIGIGITVNDIDFTANSHLFWFPDEVTPPRPIPLPPSDESSYEPGLPSVPFEGIMENIVILISFADSPGGNVITPQMADAIETIFNGPAPSLKDYMKTVSNGVFQLNTTLVGLNNSTVLMYQDPNPMAFYQPFNAVTNPIGHNGSSSVTDPNAREFREQTLLLNAARAIENSALLSGKKLDTYTPGIVDSVMFIFMAPTGTDIFWAHMWSLFITGSADVRLNGARVREYAAYPWNRLFDRPNTGMPNTTGPFNKNLATIAHETLHVFGFPDLYRYNPPSPGRPVGAWCIMSAHFANLQPQIPNTHAIRRYAGWGYPLVEITQNGRYTLYPVGSNGGVTAYAIRTSEPNEFILLEYRSSANGSGYDLPFTPTAFSWRQGLIISRINTNFRGNANRFVRGTNDELYVFRPNDTGVNLAGNWPEFASLSAGAGRTGFGTRTPSNAWTNTIYLYGGANTNYIISNVSAAGNTISFNIQLVPATGQTLTFIAGNNGSVTAQRDNIGFTSGTGVTSGQLIQFTAAPAQNYIVDKWYVNGIEQAGQTGTAFSYIVNNRDFSLNTITIKATFRLNAANVAPAPVIDTNPTDVSNLPNNQTVSVTITPTGVTSGQIYYTLDGTNPKTSPTRQLYTGPFQVTAGTANRITRRIIAYAEPLAAGGVSSNLVFKDITFAMTTATLRVTFQGRPASGPANIEDLRVIWARGGFAITYEETVRTNVNGETQVTLPAGNDGLSIWVKGERTLGVLWEVGTVMPGSVIVVGRTLPGGDANGDNEVDLNDLSILVNNYGRSSSSPVFNRLADFNNDGEVDLNDLSILISNYGRSGDPQPERRP